MKKKAEEMSTYFAGEKLYGDDFSIEKIEKWFLDEKEAYANLGAKEREYYNYVYHQLNIRCMFRYIPNRKFMYALGFGSAYGEEVGPIIQQIDQIIIIEPSEAFSLTDIQGVPVSYVKPQLEGSLGFSNAFFDIIICFSALHHIPNVSKIIQEFTRCLKPGGYVLIREPIVSMGDWRNTRKGLTKHERGIPIQIFREIIASTGLTVIKETKCVFPLTKRLGRFLDQPVYNSKLAMLFDGIMCSLFGWNTNYHPTNPLHKLRPTALSYVLHKPINNAAKDNKYYTD